MRNIGRRTFLKRSLEAGVGTGMTILPNPRSVEATPANDTIVMALAGFGRGTSVARGLASRDDCEFAYTADVNRRRFFESRRIADVQEGRQPKCIQDFRHALDDDSIDAILIATSDHWHALATIWACQAGKDVYVEKPCSHNCWEGQKMVEAARKYDRIVQVGTQSRSAPYTWEAKKYIETGKLGKIHRCRVHNQEIVDQNIELAQESEPPSDLDWDMFTGPAPARRYSPTFHYASKYEFWDYSGGEIVRNGVHQLDLARWFCGVEYPKKVHSTGGKYTSGNVGEIPDTQIVTYEFDELVITIDYAGYTPYLLRSDAGIREGDIFPYWAQSGTRIEIFGTEGVMFIGRFGGGWQVFRRTKNRQPVIQAQGHGRFSDADHQANFIECVRSRELPNADILESHRSTLLSHYGNISYRLGGQTLRINPETEQILGNDEAMALFTRQYRKPWAIEEEV